MKFRSRITAGCLGAVLYLACGKTLEDGGPAGQMGGGGAETNGGAGIESGAGGQGAAGGQTGSAGAGGLGGTAGTPGGTSGGGASGVAGLPEIVRTCAGKVYQCGDATDNDGDGLVDGDDPDCYGACDNSEGWFYPSLPGVIFETCLRDCYFDQDLGAGNDQCSWDHRCDPHSVAPDYPPSGLSACAYDEGTEIPTKEGPISCEQARQTQNAVCLDDFGPLTPNGCDCFGCCELPPGSGTHRWLGSTSTSGDPTCSTSTMSDPEKCRPCQPVPACLNPCGPCELCIGGKLPESGCSPEEQCPSGVQPCGLPGQPRCPAETYCVTGCCRPVVK
jgi:hypothetical protein